MRLHAVIFSFKQQSHFLGGSLRFSLQPAGAQLVIDFLRNFLIRFSVLLRHHEVITENSDLKLEIFNLRLEKKSFLFDTDSFQNCFQCKFWLKVWHHRIRYCRFKTKVLKSVQTRTFHQRDRYPVNSLCMSTLLITRNAAATNSELPR